MSEHLIVQHCSPTLAGIKTGNMFTRYYESWEDIRSELCQLNRRLTPKGIRILPLRYNNQKALIYMYRPDRLKKDLSNNDACKLLQNRGYRCDNPECCVAQLINKLKTQDEFPHEIGLFLGYPPEDVQGFIDNKANQCKYAGCWKVYGDEEKARKLFTKYKKCTNIYYDQWSKGKSLEKLTVKSIIKDERQGI